MDAINSTMPEAEGERNHCVFNLAREFKAIPELEDALVSELRPLVKLWHAQALPVIGTKPFDDTWSDFIRSWKTVKYAMGCGPMERVKERIKTADLPAIAMQYEAPETRELICLCRELQHEQRDQPFYLACRKAGEVIGTDHVKASRLLEMLVVDGVLVVEKKGTKTKATRYRYIGGD